MTTGIQYPFPVLVVNMSVLDGPLDFLLTIIGEILIAIKHVDIAFQLIMEAGQLLGRHAAPKKIR